MRTESLESLFSFMREREAIRQRRTAGEPPPWTSDAILRKFHFCNIRREDDAVTTWIRVNWREPHAGDPLLWFAMAVARRFNYPPTLREIGWCIPWDPDAVERKLRALGEAKIFGPGYLISTSSRPVEQIAYQLHLSLSPLWAARERMRYVPGMTLREWHGKLVEFEGFASFMAAQVVADAKYDPAWRGAPDWQTFAAIGPGSRRGMNRLCGHALEAQWDEAEWLDGVHAIQAALPEEFRPMHCQDLQNCLCEFDKYERVRLGQGEPKRLFKPSAEFGTGRVLVQRNLF